MKSEYKDLDKLLILKVTEEIDHHTTEKIQEEKDKKAKYEDMLVLVESRLLEIGNKS